jgi:hypothetical protein
MRLLLIHPSVLMYSEVFLRLEPLGMERVAAAARDAGHHVRVIDLQVESHAAMEKELAAFRPEAIGVSLNYLANIYELPLPRRLDVGDRKQLYIHTRPGKADGAS